MLLPTQLLTEEEKINQHAAGSSAESVFSGFGSCGSSSSDLNTPAGSEIDSTETTESDEDDFIAELTRQMAENMLQEDEENSAPHSLSNNTKAFGSPEKWYNTTSENPTSVFEHIKIPSSEIHSKQAFSEDQTNPIEYHLLSNQPQIKQAKVTESTQQLWTKKHHHQHMQNREFGHGRRVGFHTSHQAWPGMRVVFLGGSGSRSGSSGTGVFLPHATHNPPDLSRKKPGCSTVLIPERVLQTLKLHFEKREALTQSNGGLDTQQNQQLQPCETPQTMNNQELQLPQEWTY